MRSVRWILWAATGAAVLLSAGATAMATTYYLSPQGNDAASGSKSQPWQTLAKLNSVHLVPGDRVMLESGAVFPGSIALDGTEAGTAARPITICSSAKTPATISSNGVGAISAVCGGIKIGNLVLKGSATSAGNDCGICFQTSDPSGVKYSDITIDNVEITGFGGNGISFISSGAALSGYENVTISHANVHGNFGTGIISTCDVGWHVPSYAHANFAITDCDTSNNYSGSGIILGGVDTATVEYCRSAGNVGNGGGVGIWAWASKDVTFRHCISSGTSANNGGDGGGFDLDGGCVGCSVVSCLSYENEGPGYMHCDYPGAPPTESNIIAQSISVNDGRKAKGDSVGFGFCNWGSGLDGCTISNNLAIVIPGDQQARLFGVLWVNYIPETSEQLQEDQDVQHVTGCVFQNNDTYIAGSGIAYVANNLPSPTSANVLYQANSFKSATGISPPFVQGSSQWSTRDAWAEAIGQQTAVDQEPAQPIPHIGPNTASSLCAVTNPRQLPSMALFKDLAAQAAASSQ